MQIIMISSTQPNRNFMQAIPALFSAVYQIALKVLSNLKAYFFTSNVTGLVEAAQDGKVEKISSLLALAKRRRLEGKRGISKKDYDAAWHAAIRGGHIAALNKLNQFDSTCPDIWWEKPVNNHEYYYITSATTAALAGHIDLLKYFLGKLKYGISPEDIGKITKGVQSSITDIETRNKISEVLNNYKKDFTNSQWVHYPKFTASHARFLK